MASGPITVNALWATIEGDDTVNQITVNSARGSLLILGPDNIFLRQETKTGAALLRTGAQNVGEIEAEAGDSIPLGIGVNYLEHQCLGGQSCKMWFIPDIA